MSAMCVSADRIQFPSHTCAWDATVTKLMTTLFSLYLVRPIFEVFLHSSSAILQHSCVYFVSARYPPLSVSVSIQRLSPKPSPLATLTSARG
jgi:hypothetical protein